MVGHVQTVLGDVDPSQLGRTLTHEHLKMEFSHFYTKPPQYLQHYYEGKINLENVGFLRQYPYSSNYNLLLNDEDAQNAVLADVKNYAKFGGGTIVENSTEGLGRDVPFCMKVAKATGVHIVVGTGYYIEDVQRDVMKSQEDMYHHMLHELSEGCVDQPSVKAGFMGEIASVWPLRDFEKRAIRASGEVQAARRCGVSFHPHREPAAPAEVARLYLEAGGSADKAVMSHLDRTLTTDDRLLEFAELGTYCQFDLFGIEVSQYQLCPAVDMPSDAQRLSMVQLLVDEGKEDRVLMSHDIHTKHRLSEFGGHGYAHIINNVLPQMKHKGFSQATIDKITIENPARWLTIAK